MTCTLTLNTHTTLLQALETAQLQPDFRRFCHQVRCVLLFLLYAAVLIVPALVVSRWIAGPNYHADG